MKIIISAISIIVLIALAAQIYFIYRERNQLRDKFQDLSAKLDNLANENEKIKSDIDYYSKSENLLKELRQKFNYKKTDEGLIIVTP